MMDVQIGEMVSTVRAVDGESLLSPQTMARIVNAVMRAVREDQEHAKRVGQERRVTAGVSQEQAGEE